MRTDKGLTLREVAHRLNVPVSTYRDWEYGKALRGEPYEKLCEVFEISLDELLTGRVKEKRDLLGPLLAAQKSLELAIKVVKTL